MKRVLVCVLLAAMVVAFGSTPFAAATTAPEPAFSDIAGHEAEFELTVMKVLGIMSGDVGAATVRPDDPIARAEAAKVLIAMLGCDAIAADMSGVRPNFADEVPGWAWGYVNCARAMGLIQGYENGTFEAGASVTCAEAVTMLVRAIPGHKEQVQPGAWPHNYLSHATDYGFAGNVDMSSPNLPCSRGDLARLVFATMHVDELVLVGPDAGRAIADTSLLPPNMDVSPVILPPINGIYPYPYPVARTVYQYAVKVIQGKPLNGPIGPGVYFTSVNVHNPWRHTVKYATKFAESGSSGEPGTVHSFQLRWLEPDQATQYSNTDGHMDFPPYNYPDFLEGYFVIESPVELDVVGVYTGGDRQEARLGALHMERVPARIVPRCSSLIQRVPISTGVADWKLTAVPTSSSSPMIVGSAPIATCSAWAAAPTVWPNGTWVGTGGGSQIGYYTYELDFSLSLTCWTSYNARIRFDLWADNQATVFFNGTQVGTAGPIPSAVGEHIHSGGWWLNPTTLHIPQNLFLDGPNTLTVVVYNCCHPTGMLLSGWLEIYGYQYSVQ